MNVFDALSKVISEGLTYKEIASCIGQSEEWVCTIFDRAGRKRTQEEKISIYLILNTFVSEIAKVHKEYKELTSKQRMLIELYEAWMAVGIQKNENVYSGNKTKKMEAGFVYIMHVFGTDFYKIGMTKNIDTRERQLKTGNHNLRCIATTISQNPRSMESLIHSIYADNNVGGEFFEFSTEELERIITEFSFSRAIRGEES
jgi:hypothetical protein